MLSRLLSSFGRACSTSQHAAVGGFVRFCCSPAKGGAGGGGGGGGGGGERGGGEGKKQEEGGRRGRADKAGKIKGGRAGGWKKDAKEGSFQTFGRGGLGGGYLR